ncbi:MAG: hypothetical protein K2Q26_06680 [Bdellovibrionales bacterium]|nr:hypothetical protein [Bdellovibrionales bacterium]
MTILRIFIICIFLVNTAVASESQVRLEVGAAHSLRNYFQIPTSTGARIDVPEETELSYRLEGLWRLWESGSLRFVVAPFSLRSKVTPALASPFDQQTFAAGSPIDVYYKFNSFRWGYVHHFVSSENLRWDLGVTAKVRDAEIRLTQGVIQEGYTDFGFVPLIYFGLQWRLMESWYFRAQMDAAGSSQGRAIDAMVQISQLFSEDWEAGFVFRFLDGGAKNDKVNNFATNIYGLFSLSYNF